MNDTDPSQETVYGHGHPPPPTLTDKDRTYGMLCHLLAFSGVVGVGFGHIVGPLIIWLFEKDERPFVDDQGRESLNFQITWSIIGLVWGVVIFISVFTVVGMCVTIPIGIALGIIWLIFVIIAAMQANKGIAYRYPFNIRFL